MASCWRAPYDLADFIFNTNTSFETNKDMLDA